MDLHSKYMHLHGLATERAPATARLYFEMAALKNDVDALTHLGRMAMIGEGGPQDPTAARNYWAEGARLGDGRCAFNLGIANAGGHGAEPSFVDAYAWFLEAERLGNVAAADELKKLNAVMTEQEVSTAQKRQNFLGSSCDLHDRP